MCHDESSLFRRQYLQWGGGLCIAGSAGCLRLAEEGEENNSEPNGATVSNGSEDESVNDGSENESVNDGSENESVNDGSENESDVELTSAWSGPSGPLTVADGDFFIRTGGNRVGRVKPSGEPVFEATMEDGYYPSLSPGYNNAIHAGNSGVYLGMSAGSEVDTGGSLYALDAETGEELWMYEEPDGDLHENIRSVIVADDLVIYGSQSTGSGSDQEPIIRGLDAVTGAEQWQIQLSDGFVNSIISYEDRLFIKMTFKILIYQLSTQELLEERRIGSGFAGLSTIGETLFVPGDTIHALALPTGDERWSVWTGREVNSGIGVGEVGVFVGTEAGYVLGYDRDTGDKLWDNRVAGVIEHPPIVEDELVWIATERGNLIAFDERTGEQVYEEEVVPGFEFVVQDGILKDNERDTAYEIVRA